MKMESCGGVNFFYSQIIWSDYATVWRPRTVHKTIGHLGWSCRKVLSKKITNVGMYLIEETPKNCFSDDVTTWTFSSHIESPMHNLQPWRNMVRVVDGFFFHLDNEDRKLFRYPISLLAGKDDKHLNTTITTFLGFSKSFLLNRKVNMNGIDGKYTVNN